MTGPSTGPLTRCPFAHCSADLMLVIEQATPGDDETTVKRVPQHRIVGEAERFGQCPASLMVIPLDAYSREALTTQARAFAPMLKGGGATPEPPPDPPKRGGPPGVLGPRPAGQHLLTPRPSKSPGWFRPGGGGSKPHASGGVNVPQAGKAGRGVTPLPDGPHAGPGEGRASKPFQPTADDIVEQQAPPKLKLVPNTEQGSTGDMSDNDLRSQLISLTNLAIDGFGQQQAQCAAMLGVLEGAFAQLTTMVSNKQAATHQLALAAVGSRASIPASAAAMIGASASAGSTIDEIEQTTAQLIGWVRATQAQAGLAANSARDYLAQI